RSKGPRHGQQGHSCDDDSTWCHAIFSCLDWRVFPGAAVSTIHIVEAAAGARLPAKQWPDGRFSSETQLAAAWHHTAFGNLQPVGGRSETPDRVRRNAAQLTSASRGRPYDAGSS